MTTEPYFSEEHGLELRSMLTRLVDFMHANRVQQLVGCGPSSSSYAVALERAYQQRYGAAARPLRVVNLGRLGELLSRFAPAAHRKARDFLHSARPRFRFNAPTLMFDEEISSSRRMKCLVGIFKELSVPHKSAVLFKLYGELDEPIDGAEFMPDYWRRYADMRDPLRLKVYIERGNRVETARTPASASADN